MIFNKKLNKIQNYKDFDLNRHLFTTEKQAQLDIYFTKWFDFLGIENIDYYKELLKGDIQIV